MPAQRSSANTLLPVPQLGGKGSIIFIDRATAIPLQTVDLPAEPVDILPVH